MDIESLKRAAQECRESWVQVGKYEFKILRPYQLDILQMSAKNRDDQSVSIGLVLKFVVDWKGVTADDIVPGKGSEAIGFDPDLFAIFISDRFETLAELSNAIGRAVDSAKAKLEDDLKN